MNAALSATAAVAFAMIGAVAIAAGVLRYDLQVREHPLDKSAGAIAACVGVIAACLIHDASPRATAAIAVLLAVMGALAIVDSKTTYLPDSLTLPLIWAGLLLSTLGIFATAASAILGAAIGYISLRILGEAFRLMTGKVGMGQGDMKLMAAIGAWGGWQSLAGALFCASLVAFCVQTVVIIAHRGGLNRQRPFGPYLAASGAVWVVLHSAINHAWLHGGL